MADLYSQTKAVHHPEQLKILREGKIPRPIHVQLVISDLCNHSCVWCAYRMETGLSSELFPDAQGQINPNRKIPTEKALEIVEDCAEMGVKAIQFTGGGEPTVHPDHLEIMHRAQYLGLDTALVTNGIKMNPSSPTMLAHKWIRVSIDAGNAVAYARERQVPEGHWDKVWKNVEALAPMYAGVLGIGFVITPQNYTGILNAARRAKAAGADNMRVGAVFSEEGLSFYRDASIPAILETIAEAKAEVDDGTFQLLDLFGRRLGELDSGSPEDPECYYQFLTVYIEGDLSVYRCVTGVLTL